MLTIACSPLALWWYGEMDTVFALAFLLLALYALWVWDSYKDGGIRNGQ